MDLTINPEQCRTVSGNPAIATDTVVGNFNQGSIKQRVQIQPLEILTYITKP